MVIIKYYQLVALNNVYYINAWEYAMPKKLTKLVNDFNIQVCLSFLLNLVFNTMILLYWFNVLLCSIPCR